MTGETDLKALIRSMRPALDSATYMFVTSLPTDAIPPSITPRLTFREAEGLTLIVERQEAERAGLAGTFPCRMITLSIHSSLEAVGFLAVVTGRLAAAGLSANAVSAFYHDHLFVPVERAAEALGILKSLALE